MGCTNGPKDRTETIDDVLDGLERLGLIEFGEEEAEEEGATNLRLVGKSGERSTTDTLEVAGFIEADSAASVVGNQMIVADTRGSTDEAYDRVVLPGQYPFAERRRPAPQAAPVC